MNKDSHLYQEISFEECKRILTHSLGIDTIKEKKLLDRGLFNTTYKVMYGSHDNCAVLRLGPVNRHLLMGFEENLMEAETYVYKLYKEKNLPCSKVLACDTSKNMIERDFMITEYIDSIAMSQAALSEEEQMHISKTVGKYTAEIHAITNTGFGTIYQCISQKEYGSWFNFIYEYTDDILSRLQKFKLLNIDYILRIRAILKKIRHCWKKLKFHILYMQTFGQGIYFLQKLRELIKLLQLLTQTDQFLVM